LKTELLASGRKKGDPDVSPGWYFIGLGIILLLALALRLTGLTWGFPHIFNVDEQHTVSLAKNLAERFVNSGSLDPHDSSYGALPLYLLAVGTAVASQVLTWLKVLLTVPFNSAPMVYVGRLLSAIESAATVWLTAELAHRLYGRAVALLSALFLAISLLPVRESHFATVDTLLVALMALALLLGEKIAVRGTWRDYIAVGVSIALAIAVKVVAVLLLMPVLVAHFENQRRKRGSQVQQSIGQYSNYNTSKPRWTTHLSRLLITGVIIAALWLVMNPYALINPNSYFDLNNNGSILTQSLVVRGKLPVLYTLQFTGTTPYLYAVTNWLYWGMGLPLEIMALAGIGYSLWYLLRSGFFYMAGNKGTREREIISFADAYLLSWFLVYFITTGSWFAKFIRYALPLLPVLCLLASRLLVDLWQKGRCVVRVISVVLGISIVGASLAYTVGYAQIYRQTDIRLTAISWMKSHIPADASILVENDKALYLHDKKYRESIGLTNYSWRVWNPFEIDGVRSVRFQAPNVSEAQTRVYLDRLLTTDYIVISSYWKERFTIAAPSFPAQADFYYRLFNGQSGYRLIRTFSMYPKLGPIVWHDDASEVTFRTFDHPTIYVFERVACRQLIG
jgi:4-amino-4-deoxy-L-arabinose transferase-like glycosyltransferase